MPWIYLAQCYQIPETDIIHGFAFSQKSSNCYDQDPPYCWREHVTVKEL